MSLAAQMPAAEAEARRGALAIRHPARMAVLAGLCLWLSFGADKLTAVWRTGAFFDSDDAMRLVQVRDWLAGQAWFDLTAHRLSPPDGVFMHWSRVIDVPLGAMIQLFSVVMPAENAERLTRIVFPLLCMAALLAGTIRLARALSPGAGPFAPALMAAATGMLLIQFAPGRIDHHAPQICLLVYFVSGTLRALDGRHPASAALAAALAVLSLGISLENLPFIVVLAAALCAAWIWTGRVLDRTVAAVGLTFFVCGPALFLATVGPARYADTSCDAYSAFHLSALVAGGLVFAALGWIGGARLPSPAWRLGAAGLAGLGVLAIAAFTAPACLGDPLGAIDPFLRAHWLDDVREAKPLLAVLRETPAMFPALALAALLGAAAALWACVRERGETRLRWLALLAFIGVGFLLSAWQVRALSSLGPLAVMGGVFTVGEVWRRGCRRLPLPAAAVAACAAGLLFCSLFWAVVMPVPDARPGDPAAKAACLANASYAPLAALGEASVIAPIDIGAHILADTQARPIAAPYHRNNWGNRAAVEFFLAAPDAAHEIARRMQTGYLVTCPALTELAIYAAEAPQGLAALLAKGQQPDWLRPVSAAGAPLTAYRID